MAIGSARQRADSVRLCHGEGHSGLMYAYARGERSSRGIERRCVEDVAYGVIAAQQTPDHATIARFRVRHEAALAGLFSEVLGLCRESGLVKVGVIAIDGTKVDANASHHSNLDYEQLARLLQDLAGEVDAAEDELYGDSRGDELPEHLRTREGRRAALREAKEKLAAGRAGRDATKSEAPEAESEGVKLVLDPGRSGPALAAGAPARVRAPPAGEPAAGARGQRGL
jgi:hypothetical protein